MFEALTEKLTGVLGRLRGKGRLTEKDVEEALREVRLALLEADVHFRVAREFTNRVRERALGREVLEGIDPGQQVVKIVYDELTAILSGGDQRLAAASQVPSVVMLVGLQGSGKTTTAAKLALHLRRQGQHALLVAADLRRPAAIEQLVTLGRQLDIPTYQEDTSSTAVKVARAGLHKARELGVHWAILDTGGRLHIDEALMRELEELKGTVSPQEILLVVDAMMGQDAVRAAQEFHQRVGLTGLILTKMDGDARGGAALSVTQVTGVPIKFIGVGEKTDALEPHYPDRLASRILGMGDVVSLVERAQQTVDQERARELEKKMQRATFDLEDFLEQLQSLKKMGPLEQVLEMVPGFSTLKGRLPQEATDERQLVKIEAIIRSMTPRERRHPDILDGSRRQRIARGSGTTPQDVNQLLNQFRQTQKLMKQLTIRKGRGLLEMFR
ncbi:MAG: signal recognition particle protein [Dehalococcoidia bacterium]